MGGGEPARCPGRPRAVQAGRALPRPAARCPGRPRAAQAGRLLPGAKAGLARATVIVSPALSRRQ